MIDAAWQATQMAWRTLEETWATTQEQWADATTDHFERHYWDPLAADAEALDRALEELHDVLAEVERVLGQSQ